MRAASRVSSLNGPGPRSGRIPDCALNDWAALVDSVLFLLLLFPSPLFPVAVRRGCWQARLRSCVTPFDLSPLPVHVPFLPSIRLHSLFCASAPHFTRVKSFSFLFPSFPTSWSAWQLPRALPTTMAGPPLPLQSPPSTVAHMRLPLALSLLLCVFWRRAA